MAPGRQAVQLIEQLPPDANASSPGLVAAEDGDPRGSSSRKRSAIPSSPSGDSPLGVFVSVCGIHDKRRLGRVRNAEGDPPAAEEAIKSADVTHAHPEGVARAVLVAVAAHAAAARLDGIRPPAVVVLDRHGRT
jgi:hypothetical protein